MQNLTPLFSYIGTKARFYKNAFTNKTIQQWYETFENTECLCVRKRPGRPDPSEETVNRVRNFVNIVLENQLDVQVRS
jgi:hypothetical protein